MPAEYSRAKLAFFEKEKSVFSLGVIRRTVRNTRKIFAQVPESWIVLSGWFTVSNQWQNFKTNGALDDSKATSPTSLDGYFNPQKFGAFGSANLDKIKGRLRRRKQISNPSHFQSDTKNPEFFFYAGTQNQLDSMIATINYLVSLGKSVKLVTPRLSTLAMRDLQVRAEPLRFSINVAMSIVSTVFFRIGEIFRQSRQMKPLKLWQASGLLIKTHRATTTFSIQLDTVNPSFVIVANDHNHEILSLLMLAKHRRIQTAYLQHASVNPLFPALNFDVSFLDGEWAYQNYKKCEENIWDPSLKLEKRYVVLSGVKKALPSARKGLPSMVGVALSSDTTADDMKKLANAIARETPWRLVFRPHPGTNPSIRLQIEEFCRINSFEYSDASQEAIDSFLSKTRVVLAGASSILLEASLAKKFPVFFTPFATKCGDSYGFVSTGLAYPCESYEALPGLISDLTLRQEFHNDAVNRFFSYTFGGEWSGREGELVGRVLLDFDGGKPSMAELDEASVLEL